MMEDNFTEFTEAESIEKLDEEINSPVEDLDTEACPLDFSTLEETSEEITTEQEATATETEAVGKPDDRPTLTSDSETEWYVVNTYAGHENRVKENLLRRVETMNLQDYLFQILVAEEVEIEFKNGKKVEKTRNIYPGYLFVEMKMTDEAWFIVRNTPGVTGFIGSSGGGAKPFPVSEKEIDTILRRMGLSDKKVVVDFKIGDKVKVENGPFIGLEGTVESMSDESQSAIILTVLFGRETPTEISYNDIVKLEV